jgi:hypothetical protein
MLLAALVYALVVGATADETVHRWTIYSGAAAIAVLALLPPRWRLGVVLAGLVAGLFVTYMAANFIGRPN